MKWFPDAHEAIVYFRGAHDGNGPGLGAGGAEESRTETNQDRAERRARTKVRLYSASNHLDRLLTLTYAPPFCLDLGDLRADVQPFFRRVRHNLGHPFPYVWVPELHKDGERLHAHVGLGQYIPKGVLADLWQHGFVDIRRIRAKAGDGERAKEQSTAHYLSKYVGKAFRELGAHDPTDGCGRHRYEVGQGFQPRSTGVLCGSEVEAWMWLHDREPGAPAFAWSSEEIDGWEGPPTRGARW